MVLAALQKNVGKKPLDVEEVTAAAEANLKSKNDNHKVFTEFQAQKPIIRSKCS